MRSCVRAEALVAHLRKYEEEAYLVSPWHESQMGGRELGTGKW